MRKEINRVAKIYGAEVEYTKRYWDSTYWFKFTLHFEGKTFSFNEKYIRGQSNHHIFVMLCSWLRQFTKSQLDIPCYSLNPYR